MSTIKTLFSALFVILLCNLAKAQQAGYIISNFKLTGVSSPDTLPIKQYIEFSYDYQQAGTNVKLVVLPVFKGPAASITSATRTLTTATGSGTGIVSLSDTGHVTAILFRFFDASGTLSERTFPVDFRFRKFDISNVKLTPTSPANLLTGTQVAFTFDFIQTADTVTLATLPVYEGTGTAYHSGNHKLTTAQGNRSSFVSYQGQGKITGILFRFFKSGTPGNLYEELVPVDYTYRGFDISNVKFTPTSPANLLTGTQVAFTFDFIQTADTVTLATLPVYEGTGTAYHSGNHKLTTAQGNRSSFVSYQGQGKITGILFRFFKSGTPGNLYEELVPVDYTYRGFDISNVKLTPLSPDTLVSGTQIAFTFDFLQTADTVTLATLPIYEGTGTAYHSGNHSLTTAQGNRSSFVSYMGQGKITGILFRFFKSGTPGNLYEELVPVDYTYQKYSLHNIRFTPSSPDTLASGQQVTFSYDYAKTNDTVKLIAIPSYTGGSSWIGSPNRTFIATSGSDNGFFTLPDSGHVNKLTLRLYNTKNVLVYETSVPCNFYFFDYNISNVVFTPPSPDTLPLNQTVQFSYRYFQNSGTIKLVAYPSYKGKGLGYTSSATRTFTTPTGTSTGFVGLLADGKVDMITFRMFADTGDVYTKSYKVNYTFGNPIITAMDEKAVNLYWQLFPNPVSDYFTIRFSSPQFRYEMIDVSGKVVKQEEVVGTEVTIGTLGLSKGIYTIKISNGASTEFRKMVVQ